MNSLAALRLVNANQVETLAGAGVNTVVSCQGCQYLIHCWLCVAGLNRNHEMAAAEEPMKLGRLPATD